MQTSVREIMRPNPEIIAPDSTVAEAARKMDSLNCGVLPVGTQNKPEGIITDRDIAVRVVARGRDADTVKVADVMTREVFFCTDKDTLEQAAETMHEHHVNRLLVKDTSGRMCGILSFGNMLRNDSTMEDIHRVLECTVGKKAA